MSGQSIVAIVVEIDPTRAGLLDADLKAFDDNAGQRLRSLDALHYLNIVKFTDALYDPLLVIECAIDGEPRHFWPALDRCIGAQLRTILAHAKTARMRGALAPPRTTAELLAYLDRHSVFPSASHHGNRGLSRARIAAEQQLFEEAQRLLDDPGADGASLRTAPSAKVLHATLRRLLDPPPPPPSRRDWWERWLGGTPCGVAWVKYSILALGLITLFGLCVLIWRVPILIAVGVPLALAGVAAFRHLRRLEDSDPVQDRPVPDEEVRRLLRGMTGAQNHLASIVHVKPGVMRALLMPILLMVLRVKIRLCNTHGYLGAMRTIHFAHWSLIGNGGRLLFLSNYDGSWDSYLDDFVEKAARGLTVAWGNCVGFPPTRSLSHGGAEHGREFKLWAMQSQRPTSYSYRAYPDLSVNLIERFAAVAEGLYQPELDDTAAARWAAQL